VSTCPPVKHQSQMEGFLPRSHSLTISIGVGKAYHLPCLLTACGLRRWLPCQRTPTDQCRPGVDRGPLRRAPEATAMLFPWVIMPPSPINKTVIKERGNDNPLVKLNKYVGVTTERFVNSRLTQKLISGKKKIN